jgi:hypothetical protein
MTHGPDPDPLATASRLTAALDAMTAELKTVNARQDVSERYGHRNRLLIWLTVTALGAVVVLTVLLVFVYGAAQDATTRADATAAKITAQHQSLLSSCQAGNTFRAEQVTLWDRVLSETDTNLSLNTATGRKLLAYIRVVFRQVDCRAVYHLP